MFNPNVTRKTGSKILNLNIAFCYFSLDLNALNLPHADDSDASEKENEEHRAGGDDGDPIRTLRPASFVCSLSTKMATPPPPPPPPSQETHAMTSKPSNGREVLRASASVDLIDGLQVGKKINNGCPVGEAWEPLEPVSWCNSC